ncbi:MAG: CPBP family glutamic-type intramembrane protease, partial [Chloroflexi bacterium]|nr:CPBP family glutamic-type intramembrane protease [Chloroflexota bacterium]
VNTAVKSIDITTWKTILEFCAILLIGVLNYLLGTFFWIKNLDFKTGFSASDHLLNRWLSAMSTIVVVLLVANNQPNGVAFVGLYPSGKNNNISALLSGIAITYVALLVYALIYRLISRTKGKKETAPDLDMSNPLIAEDIKYHDWRERLAYLTVLPLMIISEDLVFRGCLVWFLGNKTGTFLPWVIISIALSIIMHLYQGRNLRTVITHFIYASVFVGLLIIFRNLLAAISAHLFLDTLFTAQIWLRIKAQDNLIPAIQFNAWKIIAYSIFIITNIAMLGVALVWLFG